MSSGGRLWVGYSLSGGRAVVDFVGPGSRALMLGAGADSLASLVTLAAKEAGAHPVVLDLDGSLSRLMSGYLDTFDYRSFLYDSFRLDSSPAWHSQLAAGAYAAALDLTNEEEAIVNFATQTVASDETLLSPVSLHDAIGGVRGFRGYHVDNLKGRIAALMGFDAVDDLTFSRLLKGDLLLDFHRAPYPQAAELAACLILAKLLAISHSTGEGGFMPILTGAHRIFKAHPRPSHSNRLLTHLLGSTFASAYSSTQTQAVNPLLFDGCPVRLYSNDAGHGSPGPARTLPGTFVLDDLRSSERLPFIPRRLSPLAADPRAVGAPSDPTPHLVSAILEHVRTYPLSTPESVVRFLSPEFLPADVTSAITLLRGQECLILEPKQSGSGPSIFAFTVTEKGRILLGEMTE